MVHDIHVFVFIWMAVDIMYLTVTDSNLLQFVLRYSRRSEHEHTEGQSGHIDCTQQTARRWRGRGIPQTPSKNGSVLWVVELGEALQTLWSALSDKFLIVWVIL